MLVNIISHALPSDLQMTMQKKKRVLAAEFSKSIYVYGIVVLTFLNRIIT